MKVLPYINQEYTSSMKPTELLDRLSQWVEPRQFWTRSLFKRQRSKPFEGEVTQTGFEIRPIIRYRNSFIPMIIGTVTSSEEGSSIQLEMKLHPFVKSFMSMWLAMVGVGVIGSIFEMIQTQSFSLVIVVPLMMWGFGYVLANKGFAYEAKPAQSTLEGLFSQSSNHQESEDLPDRLEVK